MRPNLTQDDLTEFFDQHEIKVFKNDKFALYVVSSFDGTISFFNSLVLNSAHIIKML